MFGFFVNFDQIGPSSLIDVSTIWGFRYITSETEIGCAFINADIAETVTGDRTGDIYDGVGPSDRLFSRQYIKKKNEDLSIKHR